MFDVVNVGQKALFNLAVNVSAKKENYSNEKQIRICFFWVGAKNNWIGSQIDDIIESVAFKNDLY